MIVISVTINLICHVELYLKNLEKSIAIKALYTIGINPKNIIKNHIEIISWVVIDLKTSQV